MSTQAALPLPVSVGRPGLPEAGGVKGGPAGPSAAVLDTAGYDIDPTDGGRDLHRHDLRAAQLAKEVQHRAVFYSQITSPKMRRSTQPLTRAHTRPQRGSLPA
jgi:hypothetical protein